MIEIARLEIIGLLISAFLLGNIFMSMIWLSFKLREIQQRLKALAKFMKGENNEANRRAD